MEFRQLKSFLVVAEELNFTRAAEKLYLAQSSVSAQIQALEQSLDAPLFERIGKTVILTDAGKKLKKYARKMMEMAEEIQSEIKMEEHIRGSLVIRMPETLATYAMPWVVEEFQKNYPLVSLRFINCSDQQLKHELNTGRLDLAFLIIDTIHIEGVNFEMLRLEELILAAAPSHLLAEKREVFPEDLRQETLLLPRTD